MMKGKLICVALSKRTLSGRSPAFFLHLHRIRIKWGERRRDTRLSFIISWSVLKGTQLRSMESSDSKNSSLERLLWKENEWNESGLPNKLALKIDSHVFSSKPFQGRLEFLQIKWKIRSNILAGISFDWYFKWKKDSEICCNRNFMEVFQS